MTATDLVKPALGGYPVLVVEDDEDSAAALAAVLRLHGFDARTTRTRREAVAELARSRPRAVVVDLGLPDGDGLEVIRVARTGDDPPAVVVVSGHTAPALRKAATLAGASAYLLKPADPVELVGLIARLCQPGLTDATVV